ncbi:MAG: RIP metalloprotease RseP [Planctomycetes bacterium]|nr:RIP metalloprotease RseP [Planctomycetota bacterium]
MLEILNSLLTILIMLVGIGILIFVHELGHLVMAKRSGVKVEAFALGFGPVLWGFKWGETHYRLCLVPLGGYAKMAGENIAPKPGEKPLEPYEFYAKPPFTRIKIFAAGAIMNFLVAFPACILVYIIGVNLIAPVVGEIAPGSAEWHSNLQKGDTIISIAYPAASEEIPIKTMDDYRRELIRAPLGAQLMVRAERKGVELTVPVTAGGSTALGVQPAHNIIHRITPNSAADKVGLKVNDEILEINGETVFSGREIAVQVYPNPSKPITVKVRRSLDTLPAGMTDASAVLPLTVTPDSVEAPYYDVGIEGMFLPEIERVKQGGPADLAGLQSGDRIVSINNEPVKSWQRFTEIIKANPDKELKMVVLRDDKELIISAKPSKDPAGKGYLLITPKITNELGDIIPGSAVAEAGVQAGDRIISATIKSDIPITSLLQLTELADKYEGKPLEVVVQRGDEEKHLMLTPRKITQQGTLGIELKAKSVRQQYRIDRAIVVGAKETFDLLKLTWQLIWKLVTGEESPKGLAGPIGIFHASYNMVQEGISKFIWLLALFSINLAILNLLPVPILDGGGILFCLIEKVRGKPVSVMVQAIAQYIGLFLLLTLVVFASRNDIIRLINY